MKKIFFGKVENCKPVLEDQRNYNLVIASFNGKEIELIISAKKKNRSNSQNKYYWGVCLALISEYTGYSENEAHDAMRMLFLVNRENKIPTLKSTTKLSTVEFEKYLSDIRMFASNELGCYIPEPNEVEI